MIRLATCFCGVLLYSPVNAALSTESPRVQLREIRQSCVGEVRVREGAGRWLLHVWTGQASIISYAGRCCQVSQSRQSTMAYPASIAQWIKVRLCRLGGVVLR